MPRDGGEIEITPAMVTAGEFELRHFDRRFEGEDEKAVAVFAQMARAAGFTILAPGLAETLQSAIRTAGG